MAALIGVWIFLFAAGFSFLQSAHDVLETRMAYMHDLLAEEGRDEFFESVCFMASNAIFFSGCFPFMPGLFTGENEAPAHEFGAWLFTLGSVGFVMAAYFNALGLSSIPADKENESVAFVRRLATNELLLTILGSVLFVIGSILYRPSLDTRCAERATPGLLATGAQRSNVSSAQGAVLLQLQAAASFVASGFSSKGQPAVACADSYEEGTWMYIIGSSLFLVQSVLHAWRSSIMHESLTKKLLKDS